MIEQLQKYKEELEKVAVMSAEEVEQLRIKFLGQKGILKDLFGAFKSVPNEQKKEFGRQLNELKNLAQEKISDLKSAVSDQEEEDGSINDLTLPGNYKELGARHPISLVRQEIIDIFAGIGFSISEGPEVEDDWHNFTALNFPEEHPARDMQDTFFVENKNGEEDLVLRTHTSSVQVRIMEAGNPPIRTISPGKVFRNEAISARSHCIFHQVEGLYIDKGVSFADLMQTLQYFASELFGPKAKIRMRPSYFPFTEPSAEVDVWWGLENESDYRITKGTGWLEIMGCGMVDPNVLINCGIDPNEYSGYAFGMGIERIAMNRYGIDDIRMFFENDIRFLRQFKSAF
ncbi:MAG: phenylalanine--tRNA ligase subunit alpha [Salibacteraceae bacterium]|nr:phenylalanine--tRNA ligase subunit alpha [Salibacteraceae bacterium]|tara:strand:+ start:11609 stop:12640 length:1032 start_codon:yes stop_codon:yes gene_type:complete